MLGLGCSLFVAKTATATPSSGQIQFPTDREAPGDFRVQWAHGSKSLQHNTDERIQVQRYNAHTFVMRQNLAVHWEAPFMYLLFGNDRAILVDTGATANPEYFPIREKVDLLIDRWMFENNKDELELIVAQVSPAEARVQGHEQFRDRPNTVFMGKDLESIKAFAGVESWPDSVGSVDLGGRELVVLPTPGTGTDPGEAVTFYDPYTRWLLTGDVVLPGRLWVTRWDDFQATIDRLVAFAEENPVYWVMGSSIDMSYRPGIDYRLRHYYRPTETVLQMEPDILSRVAEAADKLDGGVGIEIYDDFILMNNVPRGARAYGWPGNVPERFSGPPTSGLR